MKSNEIRKRFLDYFKQHQHEIVSSSPLIPGNDATLLFTNAGMVQFKDVFLGLEKRSYARATSSQRCVRAGGKHNDLENVGYTARHHTFFEMLGNFSFGDYFKRDTIRLAWEFLTKELNLPAEKLWITVFEEDDEAADIWLKEIGIDPARFSRCGEKDNFWAMGESGPCGPCSEIFYDHGPEIPGGPPGSPEQEGDRYIEIWNLVFMQFNREPDGKIKPLPKPSIDTGMGLERIAAVMQGVHNNYEIDLFQSIIRVIAALAHLTDLSNTSLRVIADHIRSTAFLITDGVMPSNEGRGYVLRRIIRRALRHGNKIGLKEPFFYKLVKPLMDEMGDAYPELIRSQQLVEQTIKREEELFADTLDEGLKIFNKELKKISGKEIAGEIVFKLYDTYGFPLDLTADIAREQNLTIDEAGFHREMTKQRTRSQAASQFAAEYININTDQLATVFSGYEHLQELARITSLFMNGEEQSEFKQGQDGVIILDKTPFYAESGGQVGDQGMIQSKHAQFQVTDTKKQGELIFHYGKVLKGTFHKDEDVSAVVERKRRLDTAYNHSATHLLNAALRNLLGNHVLQKGSLVEPERLRFDFSHFEPLSKNQIRMIEDLVNEKIRANLLVETKIMTPEEAMDSGAVALFGEKYGKEVRVLCMGDFSMELCGGTHVKRTGDIGIFKIVSEIGIAAGIRRIEAVTGAHAFVLIAENEARLDRVAELLRVNREMMLNKLEQFISEYKQLEKETHRLKQKLASGGSSDLSNDAKDIHGIKVLVRQIEETDGKILREMVDKLKDKLGKAIIVLASVDGDKISLVAGVTKNLLDSFNAGELVNYVAEQVGGKGGGRGDIAMAGGNQPGNLIKALESVYPWVQDK